MLVYLYIKTSISVWDILVLFPLFSPIIVSPTPENGLNGDMRAPGGKESRRSEKGS